MHFMAVDQDMAERLREARKLAGYGDAQEAVDKLGWVYSTYMNHEGGHRGFTHTARRYAAAYRVNLTWLITGQGTPRGKEPIPDEVANLTPEERAVIQLLRSQKSASH